MFRRYGMTLFRSRDPHFRITVYMQKVIDYLKMDVEGHEWAVLKSLLKSGILARVKQFGFEVHNLSKGSTTARQFFERWQILRRLELQGFQRWYWHFNFYGTYSYQGRMRSCCYELVYINVNFMSKTLSRN